jgi:hypothetical protein
MSEEIQVVGIAGQTVVIACDPEVGIWYVRSSTVPGLTSEAASASDLIEELQVIVRTLSLP